VLKENFKKLEEAILSGAAAHYAGRLVSVVLYGSAGRGTQRFDSDIDLLIIARDLPR
jgi:predicted nucleotidyltransferase